MDRVRCEDVIAGKGRPFTGAEYLESLRDGREVYVYGERVKDVTTHPAFRNAARSIARLYDALHDDKTKGVLTAPTDTGSGGFTHKFFRAARSRDLLLNALFTLMAERGFERLTTQNLIDRAGVGRATFYAHFQNKDELLVASIGRLRVEYSRFPVVG